MKRNDSRPILVVLACLACAPAVAQYSAPTDPNARDLLILTEWFEGEFDNEEQLWYQADPRSDTADSDKHPRLHTMHARLDLPEFGEHVFYVEEYKNNDPTDLVRQRFVIFSSDGKQRGIRMQQGFFKNPGQALGAQFDPSKLSQLNEEEVFFLDECDVYWRREADQFVGQIAPKKCVFGEDEKRRYSVHKLILSADKYWRVDATRLVSDDSLHIGLAEDNPTEMRRADPFVCELSIPLDGGDSQKVEGLRLHSQGGIQTVTREDNGDTYEIRLRDKEYPFYNVRPDFLFLALRKSDESRSLAYAIGDSDSRRLGLSFSGMLLHCFRDGYTFRQDIEQL